MFNRPHVLQAAAVAVLASACTSPTSYHLISTDDAMKVLVTGAPPTDWSRRSFDDSQWQSMTVGGSVAVAADAQGTMPAVCARRRFDLGPQADAYHTLTLRVGTTGAWTAYLNGTQVAQADGASAAAA